MGCLGLEGCEAKVLKDLKKACLGSEFSLVFKGIIEDCRMMDIVPKMEIFLKEIVLLRLGKQEA